MKGDAARSCSRMPVLGIGAKATLALTWEATAAKPGNVYRGADFEDMTFADMLTAAAAVGQAFGSAPLPPVGELVLEAVRAMRLAVGINTHLGSILLMAPLAHAVGAGNGGSGVRLALTNVLQGLTTSDARAAYEAIRLASPGGLATAPEQDVADEPTVDLAEAMRLASDRDLVARQYANGYREVLLMADRISASHAAGQPLGEGTVWAYVEQMSELPDTLIARKCGRQVAEESAARAAQVLGAGPPDSEERYEALADLDFWLRADLHRRNPGATADVAAAALFLLLLEDKMTWPVRF